METDARSEIDCCAMDDQAPAPAQREGRRLRQGVLTDTGAGASVADGERVFPECPLEESEGSRSAQKFAGAGSETLANRGQRKVRLRLGAEDGCAAGLKFQDAAVRRPILSVGDSTSRGNCFWYDENGSFIVPKGSPEIAQVRALIAQVRNRIPMRKQNNVFVMDAWMDSDKGRFFPR